MNPVFWLGLLLIMLGIEIATLGLTTIWFAGGALVAFFVSVAVDNWLVEWIVWLVISTLCLLLFRPLFIDKYNKMRSKTNVEALIGQTGRVTETIDNFHNTGSVFVSGNEWTARSEGEAVIEPETKVTVVAVSGVKVIVKPYEA